MSGPRVLMAGGGTAGHLFPCIAVAEEIEAAEPEAELRFVGARGRIDEQILAQRALPHDLIDARPLPYRPSLEGVRGLVALLRSVLQARSIIDGFRPDAVFSTGGFVGAAVGIAARLRSAPLVLHAPDVVPGRGNRMLARWATAVTTVSPEVAEVFGDRAVVTGNPIRREVVEARREDGIRELGLDAGAPMILVTGGSQGARRLNTAVLSALPALLDELGAQIVHLTGSLDYESLEAEVEARFGSPERYHLIEHLPNPGPALAAADLVVTRAGASSLAEAALHGVPMIVVPYPHAGGHQRRNAQALAEAGAAVLVEDEEFTPERLLELARAILSDEGRRRQMAEAALAAARPGAAGDIADIVLDVAQAALAEQRSSA